MSTTRNASTWTYNNDVAASMTDGSDVVGYDVEAVDGSIGKIDAASHEADNSHLVVDTGWWIFGKKRLIPAAAVQGVSRDDEKVFLSLTKDEVKNAPDFDYDRDTAADPYFGEADRPAHDDYYADRGW